MKIAIVVTGRFHAFDLARGLIARGHEVTVFTTYPAWAARRFGLAPENMCSFPAIGVLERVAGRLGSEALRKKLEPFLLTSFGKWAAKQVSRQDWDVIHEFSGMGEEVIRATRGKAKHLLGRGSSHIRTQAELLRQESVRTGGDISQPSPWIIEREEREYAIADYIVVLSRFCFESFVRQRVPAEKVLILPLGVDTRMFSLSAEMVEKRCQRILSGAPLTVLTTGAVSLRKGIYDFAQITRALEGKIRFRWIGGVMPEAKAFLTRMPTGVEFVPHQPQSSLPTAYAEADLFLLPTIEDGFGMVLTQAQANSLPLLTTTNSSGPDIIHEGQTGWVLPIRNPESFISRLLWCDSHRVELAQMVRGIARTFRPRDWSEVAADFESLCTAATAAV
jgi:glycosyltransferase involved in cell wall biosynthesis